MNYEKVNRIIFSGRTRFEKTDEFIQKAALIKCEIETKYQCIIGEGGNIFKRLYLILKMKFEIRQEIEKCLRLEIFIFLTDSM